MGREGTTDDGAMRGGGTTTGDWTTTDDGRDGADGTTDDGITTTDDGLVSTPWKY